jgi:hypothetical protein
MNLPNVDTELTASIQAGFSAQHAEDGTHAAVTCTSLVDSGAARITSVVTTPAFSANTNNWNPVGLNTARIIRLTTDGSGAKNLTGIYATSTDAGRLLTLINVGSDNVILAHENTGSHPAYRFTNPGAAAVTLNAGDCATVWYDATSARWRPIGAAL